MEPPTFVASREDDGETVPPPFRFVGPAFLVIVVHTALVLLTPPNPVQGAFAVAALVATGYCILSLIVGRSVLLSLPEALAFTVGLSILAISTAALVVSSFGIPFGVGIIDVVGLPVAVLASVKVPWYRPSRGGAAAFLSGLIDLRDYSRAEKIIAVALVVAIFAALGGVLALVYSATYPEPRSLGLAITGSDGTPASLPTRFIVGQPRQIKIAAFGGSVAENVTVVIRLVPTNATGNATFHAILWDTPIQLDPYGEARKSMVMEAGGTWTETVTISLGSTGEFWLRFILLEPSSAVAASSQFVITVSP